MKIIDLTNKILGLQESNNKLTNTITIIEAGYIWSNLNSLHTRIKEVYFYEPLIHDSEFKRIIHDYLDFLKEETKFLEEQTKEYRISQPDNSYIFLLNKFSSENDVDEWIHRQIGFQIQNSLQGYTANYITITSSNLRNKLLKSITREATIYDKFFEFGKLKGWIEIPPIYEGYNN